MKNRYCVLKEMDDLTKLVSLCIVSISIMDWIVIYEYYLLERKTLGKMQSYCNTSENYKMSESQVRNIVYWMENN